MLGSNEARLTGLSGTLVLSLGLLIPAALPGQELREVAANQVAVSSDEATLRLEFRDGDELEISFRSGRVTVDGQEVGTFSSGSDLEAAWRALLGQAVALDDGPLAAALREWEPPSGLETSGAEVARSIDQALESALTLQAPPTPDPEGEAAPRPPVTLNLSGDEVDAPAAVLALLARGDRLAGLGRALEGLEMDRVTIRMDEDVTVEAGSVLDATLVVVGADARVAGELMGNLVVVDGDLHLLRGSRVAGDIRLADARLFREGGVVEGRVRTIDTDRRNSAENATDPDEGRDQLERRLARELRDEIRTELRNEMRSEFRGGGLFGPLRHIIGGLGGLVQNVLTFAILAAIGLAVVYFGRENLEVVAETARRETMRSALVGVAGAFLAFPVWVLGIVALVVSIIGIPVALAWIPLFPLAVAAGAALGYMGVALKVGEWVAERDFQGLEWVRTSNPFYALVAGLGALMVAFAAANVAQMAGPALGPLRGILTAAGTLATVAALVVGFGAVLLTRGGRRPGFVSGLATDPGADPWETDDPLGGAGTGYGSRPGGFRSRTRSRWSAGESGRPGDESDADDESGAGSRDPGDDSADAAGAPDPGEASTGGEEDPRG